MENAPGLLYQPVLRQVFISAALIANANSPINDVTTQVGEDDAPSRTSLHQVRPTVTTVSHELTSKYRYNIDIWTPSVDLLL